MALGWQLAMCLYFFPKRENEINKNDFFFAPKWLWRRNTTYMTLAIYCDFFIRKYLFELFLACVASNPGSNGREADLHHVLFRTHFPPSPPLLFWGGPPIVQYPGQSPAKPPPLFLLSFFLFPSVASFHEDSKGRRRRKEGGGATKGLFGGGEGGGACDCFLYSIYCSILDGVTRVAWAI